jgi:hypothetical protein
MRKYIDDNCYIIDIIECLNDKYLETQQDTIIFIVRKRKGDNKRFAMKIGRFTIFNKKIKEI